MIPSVLLTVAALAALLGTASMGNHVSGMFKMLASTGFIAMAVSSGACHSLFGLAVLVGLFFSWWGDLFLISGTDKIFLLGVGAFFLAHVAYGAAFILYGVRWDWSLGALAVLLVPAVVMALWLNPHLGDMRVPVFAYIVVITLMVALAAGASARRGDWVLLLGALLFYASDIFVARGRFVAPGAVNAQIGLPLYYAAQLVIAWCATLAR